MTRRRAIFLTPLLLLAAAGAGIAPALAQNAAAVVQQIHDQAYGKCMENAQFGTGSELQANCSCAADVAVRLLSEEAKLAIADGTFAQFTGPKLMGSEMERDVTLLKTCPKVGEYLKQQCAGDPGNPHCQVLDEALKQAQ